MKTATIRSTARVVLFGALMMTAPSAATADSASKAPLAVAQEMVEAWNTLDLDKIANTFAEDGVLHSMMVEPITGRQTIKEHLGKFLDGATRLELKLKNVAVVGNTVFLERVDDFDYKGKTGAVPVVGVMEIKNGKVQVWREYYDRADLLGQMGLLPAAKPAN